MPNFANIDTAQLEAAQATKEVTTNTALAALDRAVGGVDVSVAAGGTIALTAAQSQQGTVLLSGAPGSAVTVEQDEDVTVATLYVNRITTAETVDVKVGSGGTAFRVPAGGSVLLISATEAYYPPSQLVQVAFNFTNTVWTDQPAANTELFGLNDRRTKFDLTPFTSVRLVANVETAGAATPALLRGEYSTAESTWLDLDDSASGPQVDISSVGTKVSAFVTIPSAAKADNFLRIVGIDGDAVEDPAFGLVALQFK